MCLSVSDKGSTYGDDWKQLCWPRFMTGHSRNFKANGLLFTDAELTAATQLHNEHAVL